jgi:hypothetical protein
MEGVRIGDEQKNALNVGAPGVRGAGPAVRDVFDGPRTIAIAGAPFPRCPAAPTRRLNSVAWPDAGRFVNGLRIGVTKAQGQLTVASPPLIVREPVL